MLAKGSIARRRTRQDGRRAWNRHGYTQSARSRGCHPQIQIRLRRASMLAEKISEISIQTAQLPAALPSTARCTRGHYGSSNQLSTRIMAIVSLEYDASRHWVLVHG